MIDMQMLLTELDEFREENSNLKNEIGDLQEEIRKLKMRVLRAESINKGLRLHMREREKKAREIFTKINESEKNK